MRTIASTGLIALLIGCTASVDDPDGAFEPTDTTAADDGADDAPADDGPADDGPADDGPADDGPADDGPADDGPADDGPADDGPADDGPVEDSGGSEGPAEDTSGAADEGTSDDGTTGSDDGGTTGAADCMSIVDAATCMATEGCEWFGDMMFGACVGGFPGLTDTDFGESGGFDVCGQLDEMICAQTMFCVWNAQTNTCEQP